MLSVCPERYSAGGQTLLSLLHINPSNELDPVQSDFVSVFAACRWMSGHTKGSRNSEAIRDRRETGIVPRGTYSSCKLKQFLRKNIKAPGFQPGSQVQKLFVAKATYQVLPV